MVPEPSPLAGVAGAFNNKAIGDRNAGNSAKFNATETSSASELFIRDTLVGAGMLPGKRYPLPGDDALSYVLHDAGSGSPATAYDNITAQGQTTEFGDVFAGAGKIAFVVSANNGSAVDQNVVLNFADGSSSTVVVTATDWCDSTPQPGNLRAGRTSERWAGGAQGLGCGLFATQTIDLEGETLESITWPVKPNFHVFAIATDEAVTASGTATISGSAQYSPDGSVLTGTPPTFTATGGAVTPIYQWTRNGAPIPGASALTYTIVPEDAGASLRFAATGYRLGAGSQTSVSVPVMVIPATFTASVQPAITGEPQVSKKLTATTGTYTTADVSEDYQWLADGTEIAGATTAELVLSNAERGKWIALRVTATKPGYSTVTHTTSQVGPVEAAPVSNITLIARPKVAGTSRVGALVQVVPGQYSPAAVESYQWLVGGKKVAGATGRTFTPLPAHAGKALTVTVTASATGRTSVTTTLTAGTIAKAAIKITGKPVIKKGKKKVTKKTVIKVGTKLTVTKAKATATGAKVKVKVTYQWYIGSKKVAGKNGKKATYKVTRKATAKKLAVKVTYTATGHTTTTTTSAKTPKVRR